MNKKEGHDQKNKEEEEEQEGEGGEEEEGKRENSILAPLSPLVL